MPSHLCANCRFTRVAVDGRICAPCTKHKLDRSNAENALTLLFLQDETLKHFTTHDEALGCSERPERPDWMWVVEDRAIVCECDEHEHRHNTATCELRRLQRIQDRVTADGGKKLAVVRVNPDARGRDRDEVLEECRKRIRHLLVCPTEELNCIYGLNLSYIGYSGKRKADLRAALTADQFADFMATGGVEKEADVGDNGEAAGTGTVLDAGAGTSKGVPVRLAIAAQQPWELLPKDTLEQLNKDWCYIQTSGLVAHNKDQLVISPKQFVLYHIHMERRLTDGSDVNLAALWLKHPNARRAKNAISQNVPRSTEARTVYDNNMKIQRFFEEMVRASFKPADADVALKHPEPKNKQWVFRYQTLQQLGMAFWSLEDIAAEFVNSVPEMQSDMDVYRISEEVRKKGYKKTRFNGKRGFWGLWRASPEERARARAEADKGKRPREDDGDDGAGPSKVARDDGAGDDGAGPSNVARDDGAGTTGRAE